MTGTDVEAFRAYRPGYGTARLAEAIGAEGPRSTVGMVCVSSSMALIHAAELLRDGVADRAVAGGFEGFSAFIHTGFHCIGALTKDICRPFDRRRDGTALGEGAALLLLETEDAAKAPPGATAATSAKEGQRTKGAAPTPTRSGNDNGS